MVVRMVKVLTDFCRQWGLMYWQDWVAYLVLALQALLGGRQSGTDLQRRLTGNQSLLLKLLLVKTDKRFDKKW